MNGTLIHGTHRACAIGNMLYHKKIGRLRRKVGLELLLPAIKEAPRALPHVMRMVVEQTNEDWVELIAFRKNDTTRKSIIRGYSFKELYEIDAAFRSFNEMNDGDGFFGLHAVLDVLLRIHGHEDGSPKSLHQYM